MECKSCFRDYLYHGAAVVMTIWFRASRDVLLSFLFIMLYPDNGCCFCR